MGKHYYSIDIIHFSILKGKSPCNGDSGGPFVCENTLAGIVSWGRNCDSAAVFANVEHYVSWIGSNNECE